MGSPPSTPSTAPQKRLGDWAQSASTVRPPPTFKFGDLESGGKKAKTITIKFSDVTTVVYKWSKGKWQRFDNGRALPLESGNVEVDNVIIEEHEVDYAKGLVDIALNRSVEITDVTGSGRAVLFRDGRAFEGRWKRESKTGRVKFETKKGDPLVLRGNHVDRAGPKQEGKGERLLLLQEVTPAFMCAAIPDRDRRRWLVPLSPLALGRSLLRSGARSTCEWRRGCLALRPFGATGRPLRDCRARCTSSSAL